MIATDSNLTILLRHCSVRQYPCGRQVISRESKDRHVYFIVSGKVRVSVYSANGKEVAFRDLGSGSMFGEISAIDGLPRSANVEALEDSSIASMSDAVFWEVLRSQPDVMAHILKQMAATIRSLSERLFELSTLGIQNRVHAEILRLAKDTGEIANGRAVIDPAPRHVDIASRISANREQVTKELSAMTRHGLIAKAGRALVVRDVAKLERIVTQVLRTT